MLNHDVRAIEYVWLDHLPDNNDVDIRVTHHDGTVQVMHFWGPNGKLDADIAYRKMSAGEWNWDTVGDSIQDVRCAGSLS